MDRRTVKRKIIANDTFPNLYNALVYDRKCKSEYLERQIYERLLKSKPAIVKLIENKSDLSKLSTLSEPSIVKFIDNQSEHLSKLSNFISSYVPVKSKLQHPPGQPPGHFNFWKIFVQILPSPGRKAVQMPPPPGKLPAYCFNFSVPSIMLLIYR